MARVRLWNTSRLQHQHSNIFRRSSTMKTVSWRANDPELRMVAKFDWGAGLYYPMLRKFWDCFFYGDFKKHGKEVFKAHYEEIRSIVPPDNLLEYRIGAGWEPLCNFLGNTIPSKPFPHTNDTDSFVDRCRTRNRNQMMNVIFRTFLVGIPMLATAISATIAYQQFSPRVGGILA